MNQEEKKAKTRWKIQKRDKIKQIQLKQLPNPHINLHQQHILITKEEWE